MSEYCYKNKIRWFCVPIDIKLVSKDSGKLCENIIKNYPNAFLNIVLNKKVNSNEIIDASKLIKDISNFSNNGFDNFRCGISINCDGNFPFFPFSYHKEGEKDGFSLALEVSDFINKIIKKNKIKDLYEIAKIIKNKIGPEIKKIEDIAYILEKKNNLKFYGIDISLAPYPNDKVSVTELMENLGLEQFGKSGTLFITGFLTDLIKSIIKDYKIHAKGFNGVMFSLLEDHHLSKINSQRLLSLDSLILYSTVCACGIDMVPISQNTSYEEIASRILDVFTIANKLNKPLGVRFLPIPNKNINEKTDFNNDFLFNSKILECDYKSLDFEKINLNNFNFNK